MSNQPPKPSTAEAPAPRGGKHPDAGRPRKHDDDTLHVPKGVSRGTFIFLVGLMIFLLVIWLVPGAMFGISGAGPKNPVVVRFTVPGEGEVALKGTDIQNAEKGIHTALMMDPFMGYQFGIDPRNAGFKDMVRLIALDHIARAAGVAVTDGDLAKHLTELLTFGQQVSPEDLKNKTEMLKESVRQQGLDQVAFENAERLLMTVARFERLVGYAGGVPDPQKIEEQWHKENVEFAFDYVALPVAGLKEDARKELPDQAGLQAWFDKLSEGEKNEFKTAEKRKAEVALFRDTETTPATDLLTAYPEKPADGAQPTPPEELAQRYWSEVFMTRFVKDKPADADPSTPAGFLSFEETKEKCLAEAPVYYAMERWIEDLNARHTNGETIDFAAEAQKHGLDHQAFLEPLTSAEFTAQPEVGDAEVAGEIFATAADGSVGARPIALKTGIVVVRVNERTEPTLPPFDELREKVAEKWLGPKSEELAKARLAKLREGFERFEPPAPKEDEGPRPKNETHFKAAAEAFRTALQGAGLTAKTRDFLNKAGPANKDPQSEDADHKALFSMANAWHLYDLQDDEVAEPGLSGDKQTVYLVRLAGKRDVPLENMSPSQYKRLKQSARAGAVNDLGKKLDLEFLKKNYGLWLYEEEAEKAKAKK